MRGNFLFIYLIASRLISNNRDLKNTLDVISSQDSNFPALEFRVFEKLLKYIQDDHLNLLCVKLLSPLNV